VSALHRLRLDEACSPAGRRCYFRSPRPDPGPAGGEEQQADGNTDDGCVWGQDEREALGCRLILTEENGNRYYENAPDSQGWVKFLRAQAEAAGASVFHNDAMDASGDPLYPLGVSWYYTWNTFTPALPYGAFLETHREADGSAVQYARSNKYQPSEFSLVRRWENGGWTDWADND